MIQSRVQQERGEVMEHKISKSKVVLAGILASLMVCAAAMPALGQATATAGGATATGGNVNVQIQYCSQVINQYANATQNNSGGGIAAAIAQNLGITQDAVNNCVQNAPGGAGGDAGGDTGTAPDDPVDETDAGDVAANNAQTKVDRQSNVLANTIPDKVLANTGGEMASAPAMTSASSILLSAGALLLVSGITTAFWLGNRRG